MVFSQVSECLQLVFGMEVREVDAREYIYFMVSTLGLTCKVQFSFLFRNSTNRSTTPGVLITSSIGGLGSGRGTKEREEKSGEGLGDAFTGVSPPSFLHTPHHPYKHSQASFW